METVCRAIDSNFYFLLLATGYRMSKELREKIGWYVATLISLELIISSYFLLNEEWGQKMFLSGQKVLSEKATTSWESFILLQFSFFKLSLFLILFASIFQVLPGFPMMPCSVVTIPWDIDSKAAKISTKNIQQDMTYSCKNQSSAYSMLGNGIQNRISNTNNFWIIKLHWPLHPALCPPIMKHATVQLYCKRLHQKVE